MSLPPSENDPGDDAAGEEVEGPAAGAGEPASDVGPPSADPGQPPPGPYAGHPGPPAAPDAPSGDAPSAPLPGAEGPSIGFGVGIGCGGVALTALLGFGLMMSALSTMSTSAGWVLMAPTVLLGLVAIGLMFSPKLRNVGLGILIIVACAFLLVIGPCSMILLGV